MRVPVSPSSDWWTPGLVSAQGEAKWSGLNHATFINSTGNLFLKTQPTLSLSVSLSSRPALPQQSAIDSGDLYLQMERCGAILGPN